MLVPFVLAFVLAAGIRLFGKRPWLAGLVASVGPLGLIGASLAALFRSDLAGPARAPVALTTRLGHLIDLGALKVELDFTLDPVTATLLLAPAVLALALVITAARGNKAISRLSWLLVTLGGTATALLADDLLVLLAGLQAVGLGAWGLLGADAEREEEARSALKPWVVSRAGEAAAFFAIGLLFWAQGVSSWTGRDGPRREQGISVLKGRTAVADVGSDRRRAIPIGVDEAIARGDRTADGAAQAIPGPRMSVTGLRDAMTVRSTGTFDHFRAMHPFGEPLLFLVGVLLLAAAAARAGLFPLHVWTPEAAERGSTAAAAVLLVGGASGLALLVRLDFLLPGSETARAAAVFAGVATAFFAATVAVAQHDLPRVAAWSAVGRVGLAAAAIPLGITWMAVLSGVQAIVIGGAAVLAGGATVDAAKGVRDLRRMGGLFEHHKGLGVAVALTAAVQVLGLVPSVAGLLVAATTRVKPAAIDSSTLVLVGVLLVATALLAYAPCRAAWLALSGKSRAELAPPEAPRTILPPERSDAPSWVIATLSLLALVPVILSWPSVTENPEWLHGPFTSVTGWNFELLHGGNGAEAGWKATVAAVIAVVGAVIVAVVRHRGGKSVLNARAPGWLRRLLQEQYYVDDTYNLIIVRAVALLQLLAAGLEWLLVEAPIRILKAVLRRVRGGAR